MSPLYLVFETALGPIGIIWREADGQAVLTRLQLPAGNVAATREALLRGVQGAAEGSRAGTISQIALRIERYAKGEPVDFSDISVDHGEVEPLRAAIYRVLRTIPYGRTLTYGELAGQAGFPGAAREVGQAMGRNRVPLVVPCHRVVAAGGRLGGFSAPGGADTKRRMLLLEKAAAPHDPAQASFGF